MQKSKLVKVLKTFSKTDWKALQLRLQSPTFVKAGEQKQLSALFDILKQASPRFTNKQLEKEAIQYTLASKLQQTTTVSLEKLMSKLMKQIEALLLAEEYEETLQLSERQVRLARCWRQRNLPQLEKQALQKAEKSLAEFKGYDRDDFWQSLLLAEEWIGFYSPREPQRLGQFLQKAEGCLDDWYLLAKLEQIVWQSAQKIQANYAPSDTLLNSEAILAMINPQLLSNYPIHRIYYYTYIFLSAYQDASYTAYQQVDKQLRENGHLLEASKLKALQAILRIFTAGKYNRGHEEYLRIAFALYREHLEKGFLYFNEKIHSQTLLNLVILGLRSNQHQWVAQLLANHKDKILDTTNAIQATRFCNALYAFYEKNWEKSAKYLDDTYQNIYYQLAARRLELMIYWQQQSPLFDARLEAFKVYIFRQGKKSIPAKQWELNNNFVDMLRQLVHPSTLNNHKRINTLIQKLDNTEHIAERSWIKEKLHGMS